MSKLLISFSILALSLSANAIFYRDAGHVRSLKCTVTNGVVITMVDRKPDHTFSISTTDGLITKNFITSYDKDKIYLCTQGDCWDPSNMDFEMQINFFLAKEGKVSTVSGTVEAIQHFHNPWSYYTDPNLLQKDMSCDVEYYSN